MINRVLEQFLWATVAKIAVICDREFFLPFDQRVYKEVVTMKKAGHDVEIITPHETTTTKDLEGITVHCLSTNGFPGSTALKLIKKSLKKDYDIYYCHEFDPLIFSRIIKLFTRKPVIWDCHEYLVQMKKELQGNLAATLTNIAVNWSAPKVDHIVTVDNRLARSLSSFGKITVIPNYPNISDFEINIDKRESDWVTALYVGSLTERRGIKKILRSTKIVREKLNLKLKIVGDFYDNKLKNWAINYDKKHKLEIDWMGWINYRELAPVIRNADFGLFMNQPGPRYLKGLPTKIFEYMIMELPVLSAKGPLLNTLINKNDIGLTVDSTNVDSIARGMEQMATMTDLQAKGTKGNELVRKYFCWEAKEHKLLKIIDTLIN